MQSLCNKHRVEKGYAPLTLRAADVGVKCDECEEVIGVLTSDNWKMSVNGLAIIKLNKG